MQQSTHKVSASSIAAAEAERVKNATDNHGNTLMPLRDMIGYSTFVSWAFLMSWAYFNNTMLANSFSSGEGFFILKGSFLFGIALFFFCLLGGGFLMPINYSSQNMPLLLLFQGFLHR